jgi:predicted amidohydrolase YtcJ
MSPSETTGRAASQTADLIITGRIASLGGDDGFGWQSMLGIKDGRVIPVENDTPARERWQLSDDELVMPGVTDAHLHLMSLVIAERQVDLTGADLDGALARIGERHKEMAAAGDTDGWLLGHGWSLQALGQWPGFEILELVAPNRPIALWAHDHHARWVSRRALELAGIGRKSDDPGGGLIRRDEDGRPTGILHETASVLVDSAVPVPTTDHLIGGLQRVAANLASLGVTGCHDPGELTSDNELDRGPLFYRDLAAEGRLPLRVHSSIRQRQLDQAIEIGLVSGQGDGRYRMGWLKLFADGSLGSRSAALLAPYADAATNTPTGGPTGMVITDADELTELLERAAAAGISGQVHAIGDGAVRSVLDVFEGSASAAHPGQRTEHRLLPRIEHAQLVDLADTGRFGALGVAASVQPVHLRSDADAAREAWAERAENTFPLRALVDSGALIPMGTDAPVEPPDPWPGIAVAVARRDPFAAEQRLTGERNAISLARAVRAASLDPALVAGESELGRLTAGSRADLLVVPAQPFLEPFDAAAFASIRPLATLIDGEVVSRVSAFEP